MTHNEIREKLFALYDGPLAEQERKLVEGHLAGCAECRQAIGEWKHLSKTLFSRSTFSEVEDDLFVSKVMSRLDQDARRQETFSWDNSRRWMVPVMGSIVTAAWVFFQVLPGIPGLSPAESAENFFAGENSPVASSQWSVVPVSAGTADVVVALIK
jgi:anti-sigma factor RsiW